MEGLQGGRALTKHRNNVLEAVMKQFPCCVGVSHGETLHISGVLQKCSALME